MFYLRKYRLLLENGGIIERNTVDDMTKIKHFYIRAKQELNKEGLRYIEKVRWIEAEEEVCKEFDKWKLNQGAPIKIISMYVERKQGGDPLQSWVELIAICDVEER